MPIDDITNGRPTGYSFTYSSNQTISTNATESNPLGLPVSCCYKIKNDSESNEIQLLKEVLYILGKLNRIAIAPYYNNLHISGMVRITDEVTDLMLCDHSDTSNWSSLYSATGNDILITQHANLNELHASGESCPVYDNFPNMEFQLTLEDKTGESGDLFSETHALISPESLRSYILTTPVEETRFDPEEISTILGEIKDLVHDIREKGMTGNSITDRIATVRQKIQ